MVPSTMFQRAKRSIWLYYSNHQLLCNFVLLFFLNLWLALHDRVSPLFYGVNALSTPAQAKQIWGGSDAGLLLQMGLSQAKFGYLTPDLLWTAGTWPPGMSYIYKFSFKIVGLDGSFILVLATITAFLWASVLSLLLKIFQEFMSWWIAAIMVITIIQTDLYHEYLVRDAVIWSDGFGAGLLTLTLIFSYLGSQKSNYYFFLASGISLAAVIYLRAQYFSLINFLGALTILVGILWLASRFLTSIWPIKSMKLNQKYISKQLFLPLLLITTVTFSACAPYLLWQKNTFGDRSWDLDGDWHWTSYAPFVYMNNWRTSTDLGGYLATGGDGTACQVDKKLCEEINRIEKNSESPFNIYDETPYNSRDYYELTKSTLMHHPFKWFAHKVPYFYRYWISGPELAAPGKSNILFALFSAAGLGMLFVLPFFKFARRNFPATAVLSIIFVGLTLLPPYIGHLEVRYLVFTKLIGIVVFVGLFGTFANYLTTKFVGSSGAS